MGAGLCGGKKEVKMVLIGLDLAGKTSVLNRLRFGEAGSTTPTIGFNYETFAYKNTTFDIWDTGGQDKLRDLWRHYYEEVDGVLFVVDSTDEGRLNEARDELQKAMRDIHLKDAFLCVLANKRDLENCMPSDQISSGLQLSNFKDREWKTFEVSALKGVGLYDALDWVSSVKK
uniref:ADP-ribosylation factor 5-like n=1 Tax=Styela clava TaxID=7725 RepID=UPI00193A9BEA|nr:ADP-ribosylation factor 5-like [Styela clava]